MAAVCSDPVSFNVHVDRAFSLSLFLAGLFGFVFGFVGMIMYDGPVVKESGMFQGYNAVTCTVVVLQVVHLRSYFSGVFCVQSAELLSVCRLWVAWL